MKCIQNSLFLPWDSRRKLPWILPIDKLHYPWITNFNHLLLISVTLSVACCHYFCTGFRGSGGYRGGRGFGRGKGQGRGGGGRGRGGGRGCEYNKLYYTRIETHPIAIRIAIRLSYYSQ